MRNVLTLSGEWQCSKRKPGMRGRLWRHALRASHLPNLTQGKEVICKACGEYSRNCLKTHARAISELGPVLLLISPPFKTELHKNHLHHDFLLLRAFALGGSLGDCFGFETAAGLCDIATRIGNNGT